MTTEDKLGNSMSNTDREYAMKFWDRERPEYLFGQMLDAIEQAKDQGKLKISLEGYARDQLEETRQYLSAHRRMAAAMGIQTGQFLIDHENGYAVAKILETQDAHILAARKDSDIGIPYLRTVLKKPNMLQAIMEGIKTSADSGIYSRFANKHIDDVDRAEFSGVRILARAMGFQMGSWKANRGAGTASTIIKR